MDMIPYQSKSLNITSMVTLPLRYGSVDLEFVKGHDGKYKMMEFALYDNEANDTVIHTLIKPSCPFTLNGWRKQHGYSEDDINKAITVEELDAILKRILPYYILLFWNMNADISVYPNLKKYSYACLCAMKRYSQHFGSYNIDFNDRTFVKLKVAAADTGFVKSSGEFFHNALTDAKAIGHIWSWLDRKDLPSPNVPMELLLKEDVYTVLSEQNIKNSDDIVIDVNLMEKEPAF